MFGIIGDNTKLAINSVLKAKKYLASTCPKLAIRLGNKNVKKMHVFNPK